MKMISSDLTCNSDYDDVVDQICRTAIRFIGISKKTSGRVSKYLQQRGYDEEQIGAAIEQLKDRSYIDDLAVAKKMIRLRSGRRSVSAKAHRHYLINAGVSQSIVELAVIELPEDGVTALFALTGKYNSTVDYNMTSMIRFLGSRGYSADIAHKAVIKFVESNQISKPDFNE